MEPLLKILGDFWNSMGLSTLFNATTKVGEFLVPGELIMICIACLLLYLAIVKEFEPYLLIPIAFGMLLVNIPYAGLMEHGAPGVVELNKFVNGAASSGGLIYWIYQGTTCYKNKKNKMI